MKLAPVSCWKACKAQLMSTLITREPGRSDAGLVLVIIPKPTELRLEVGILGRKTAKTTERHHDIIHVASLDQVAKHLKEKQGTSEENYEPYELYSNRDPTRVTVIGTPGSIVDDRSKQERDCDGKLIGTNNGFMKPFKSRLGLIQRNWRVSPLTMRHAIRLTKRRGKSCNLLTVANYTNTIASRAAAYSKIPTLSARVQPSKRGPKNVPTERMKTVIEL